MFLHHNSKLYNVGYEIFFSNLSTFKNTTYSLPFTAKYRLIGPTVYRFNLSHRVLLIPFYRLSIFLKINFQQPCCYQPTRSGKFLRFRLPARHWSATRWRNLAMSRTSSPGSSRAITMCRFWNLVDFQLVFLRNGMILNKNCSFNQDSVCTNTNFIPVPGSTRGVNNRTEHEYELKGPIRVRSTTPFLPKKT